MGFIMIFSHVHMCFNYSCLFFLFAPLYTLGLLKQIFPALEKQTKSPKHLSITCRVFSEPELRVEKPAKKLKERILVCVYSPDRALPL